MDRPLLVLGGFSVLLFVLVLMAVRREHIRVEYSVSWLVAATILIFVSFNRGSVLWLAEVMGICGTTAGDSCLHVRSISGGPLPILTSNLGVERQQYRDGPAACHTGISIQIDS